VLLYTGGVKSWSIVSALQDLGMDVVATGTNKSTEEDKARIREIMGEKTKMITDGSPKALLGVVKEYQADILIAGGRNMYTALKARIPFLDINQEREFGYEGYTGMLELARQLALTIRARCGRRCAKEFRARPPRIRPTSRWSPVVTPDFTGCLESGYALAVKAMIDVLVPESAAPANATSRSTCSPARSDAGRPGAHQGADRAFGLRPVLLPDLADSLDGHLTERSQPGHHRRHPGVGDRHAGRIAATLVIGRSLDDAADLLRSAPACRISASTPDGPGGGRRLRRALAEISRPAGAGKARAPARPAAGRHGRHPFHARLRPRRHRRRPRPAVRLRPSGRRHGLRGHRRGGAVARAGAAPRAGRPGQAGRPGGPGAGRRANTAPIW
jgi:nitrogenase molybdenum-iron protein alpha/beta subunit